MIWLLILVVGVIAYVVFSGITKAKARMHYVNQKRAFRSLEAAPDRVQLASWGRDANEVDIFFRVIKLGGIRNNIAPSYVSLMLSTTKTRDLYMTYAAYMEIEGSSFVQQQEGCINLLQTMWDKLTTENQCKFIALGLQELDGSEPT